MPRAVLASRLKTLIAAGVMTRVAGEHHLEYELTGKGRRRPLRPDTADEPAPLRRAA